MGLDEIIAAGKAHREQRRQAATIAERLCFDKQLEFIRDEAKWKAVFTPRRSGKSTAIGTYFIEQAQTYPGRKFLYLSLTREQAENIIWQHVFQNLLVALGLKQVYGRRPGPDEFKYSTTDRILTLGNESTIILGGMDSGPQEMQKLLGGKYHMACVDECQGVRQDLKHLVEEVLEPAVSDYLLDGGGILLMGGTPGLHMGDHYWWQVTKQDEEGNATTDRLPTWKVHEWGAHENPYNAKQFQDRCERALAASGPSYQDEPSFKRQWLGKWCLEQDDKVYKYDPKKNTLADQKTIDSLLRIEKCWTFLVGLDLGWDDATAYGVVAYRPHDRNLYVVQSESFKQTTITEIGQRLKKVCDRYKPFRVMIDAGSGTGKLVAESLRIEHKLPVWPAEKTEKENAIGIMNSDFQSGLIQVLPLANEALCLEWMKLAVDSRARERGEFKEASKFQNHLADALLYAHRYAKNKLTKEPEAPKEPDFADELLKERRRAQSPVRRDFFGEMREQAAARAIAAQFRGSR